MRKNDYVIIMAGGIGSRFWPMSRSVFPKQFHDFMGTGRTLIQSTFERFNGFVPAENIFIVTNEKYADLVKAQLPEIKDDQILKEPVGRNTAPCVAYACAKIGQRNPDASIFVAASDHLIKEEEKFLKDAATALDVCRENDLIMTLGIEPSRPDTGYGYIQYIDEDKGTPYYKVKTFTEKPSLEIAKTFVASGDFVWNSGMFAFSVKTIKKAFQEYLGDMYDLFEGINGAYYTEDEQEKVAVVYEQCLNISIDYGIMEKANNVYVIPSSFGWSDLGTWGSLYEQMDKDYLGNAAQGEIIVFNASNNVIRETNPEKLIVIDGLEDYIVVDTEDVLVIVKKENEQNIKEIVAEVRRQKGDKYV